MRTTKGILAYGTHVPYRRLDRAEIAAVMGTPSGRGYRSVASFDEDTTTMGVEAARRTLGSTAALPPDALWFSTVAPAYLDKTNATAIHAALRLDASVSALDFGGAQRSAVGALRTALTTPGRTLVVSSDVRVSLPTGLEDGGGGDAAAAILTGSSADGPLLAEYLGGATTTAEFTDRRHGLMP
jgi:hydroxymethylglutaryl-CoA synthase